MKSFNSASFSNSRSNIVPFQSTVSTKVRRSSQYPGFWSRFWDGLFNRLMPSSQPIVTQKQDHDGSYYQVYDPMTQRSQTFGSELETRIWLDHRFYDNAKNL